MTHEPSGGFCAPVPESLAGVRADRAVAMVTGCSRARASQLVEQGRVKLDGRAVRQRSHALVAGQLLEVEDPGTPLQALPAAEASVEFAVVYCDDQLVVVDKPPGLVVHPGAGNTQGTLVSGLLVRFPELAELPRAGAGEPSRPGIVHRLDRGTSGLLVVARTPEAYRALVAQLASRQVQRRYLALVRGRITEARGAVEAPIGRSPTQPTQMAVSASGRPARTSYRVLEHLEAPEAATFLEVSLDSGRTHQIRVHLAAIGHPVVGDPAYGTHDAPARTLRGALQPGRVFLHAWHLGLTHPVEGAWVEWESSLPEDLASLLGAMKAGR